MVPLLATMLACSTPEPKGPVVPAGPPPAPAAAPGASVATEAVVASWRGGSLAYGAVTAEIETQLKMLENEYLLNRYQTEMQVSLGKVNEAVLGLEAKARGLPAIEDLVKAEVVEKTPPPTDAEVQEAYAQLQRQLRGRPLEEVRSQVEQVVTRKKQGERQEAFLAALRAEYGVNLALPYPDVPRFAVSADDDPASGPADAPVTIIQFAEFQCPYCGKARQTLQEVERAYEGRVRFVFRDFPLGFHEYAVPAAIAANCAEPQGKYWAVHDKLMENQRALTDADLERVAQEVGLDLAAWNACRKEPGREDEVRKDMAEGSAVGVEGTPAFFVNGVFLNGAQPFETFRAIIDKELAGKAG